MGVGYDYGRLTSDPSLQRHARLGLFPAACSTCGTATYPLAVASYNAGAGNVRKWVNAYGDPRGSVDVAAAGSRRSRSARPGATSSGCSRTASSMTDEPVADAASGGPHLDLSRQDRARADSPAHGRPSAAVHHARRASRASAPNMTSCSAIERPKLVETIVLGGGAIGDRSREWRLSSTAASGCARSTGGSAASREGDEGGQGRRSGARRSDATQVRFGATVELADEDDARRMLTIVGDDEADAVAGQDRLERADRPGADRRQGRRRADRPPARRREKLRSDRDPLPG